jgi:hypothetical protein
MHKLLLMWNWPELWLGSADMVTKIILGGEGCQAYTFDKLVEERGGYSRL